MNLYVYIMITLISFAIAVTLWKRKKKKEETDMPVGIEVYNQEGKTIFSTDMMFCRILGTFEVDGTNSSITDANIANRNIFVVIAECEKPENECSSLPVFTFTENTISWVYTSTDYNVANIAFKGKYYYGVMGAKL